jgi:BirA family biotin operon repressor/biotin-[acetyl-CoA-carboxylase] ligase
MLDVAGAAAEVDELDVGAIRRGLVGDVVGTHVYVFGDVVSTNAVLRGLADAGAREGTVVLAESQRAGRGRLDTTWFSPPGVNLYASVLFRPAIATSAAPVFSFIASLALTDAIRALGLRAGVKWPNDVVIGRRKVAGARLDVATTADRVIHVVVGVGVNVNVGRDGLATGLGLAAAEATSLREALGRAVDRNAFAAAFLNQLEKWFRLHRALGSGVIVAAWRERDVLIGRRVRVEDMDERFEGRVVGVDERGFLLVDDDTGTRRTVVSAALRLVEASR